MAHQWFSPSGYSSFLHQQNYNHHDITEILLKVALKIKTLIRKVQLKFCDYFNINIILYVNRSTDDIEMYQSECVPVTHDTIQQAVDWVWALDRLAPVAKTTTCEAVKKASMDPNVRFEIMWSFLL